MTPLAVHRGQIWLVNLEPTVGREIRKTRPALIISNDYNNQFAETVTVLPISDKGGKVYPFEVYIPLGQGGLTKESKIRCQQIRTIDKIRLVKYFGILSADRLKMIEKALLIHLGIGL